MRPAETVDSLPVIAHGKQRRVFILRPQRRKQRSALRRDILKLIHQDVFPRADEAPFLQNDNGLMDQPRKSTAFSSFSAVFHAFSIGAISLTRLENTARIDSGALSIISA